MSTTAHLHPWRARLIRFFFASLHLYWLVLLLWLLLRAITGDYFSVVYGLSAFAFYLFLPNLLVLPLAWRTRRRDLWLGVGLSTLAWVWLFGGLLLPRTAPAHAQTGAPVLRVMTYNLLGTTYDTQKVIAVIRAANPDVVGLQELNPVIATALQTALAAEYPYQLLDAQLGVTGMGLLSRYPLAAHATLPGAWVGSPQVVTLNWHGQPLQVLNVHPTAGLWGTAVREAASQTIVDFVQAHSAQPAIVLGDFNAVQLHNSYRLLAEHLQDAWLEVGTGLGHTWPGNSDAGSSVTLPNWLIRIDYVFHTPHLQALSAQVGPWDGQSDHRPVIADFTWR